MGFGVLSRDLRVALEGQGKDWEWLGWWLDWEGVGIGVGWRVLEEQKTDWGLLGDTDLDECWALMRYRHSPDGVLWGQGI